MVNDSIADFITRIRNAVIINHKIIKAPATKLTIEITKIFKAEGFIEDFEIIENEYNKYLLIFLKYKNFAKKSTIQFLKKISKPGCRFYIKNKDFTKRIGSYGIFILSTSNGIITNKKASSLNIGGEVLISIY
jgi:small subunit ribosomal protein S8